MGSSSTTAPGLAVDWVETILNLSLILAAAADRKLAPESSLETDMASASRRFGAAVELISASNVLKIK